MDFYEFSHVNKEKGYGIFKETIHFDGSYRNYRLQGSMSHKSGHKIELAGQNWVSNKTEPLQNGLFYESNFWQCPKLLRFNLL